jgi:regulator of sigma E protease
MSFLVFVVILSSLILIHELGHFLAAKFFRVKVEEFGFGLPPRAVKLFEKWGTVFSLNWLPLGGFVKLKGEDADVEAVGGGVFYEKPIWQRAVMLLSGVFMNFVLGVVLFGVIYTFLGIPTETDRVRIIEMLPDRPAVLAGIKVDDVVKIFKSNEGEFEIKSTSELVNLVNENGGEEVRLVLSDKDGGEREVVVVPRSDPPEGEGALGVVLSNMELIKYPIWQMPFRGVVVGLKEAVSWGREIATGLLMLVGRLVRGEGVGEDVAGPVGIYQVSRKVYEFGALAVFQFAGVLSVNLAILNLVPFPALDGGRVAFLAVEKVLGKRLKNRIEGTVHTVGMVILLSLMILITVRDVLRLGK